MILESAGASVISVPNADQALVEFDRARPALVISDIGTPTKDGFQLAREIRARELLQGGRVPLIALPAFAREEEGQIALEAGFNLRLTKPLDPTLLSCP